jgi:hypothetical protein
MCLTFLKLLFLQWNQLLLSLASHHLVVLTLSAKWFRVKQSAVARLV